MYGGFFGGKCLLKPWKTWRNDVGKVFFFTIYQKKWEFFFQNIEEHLEKKPQFGHLSPINARTFWGKLISINDESPKRLIFGDHRTQSALKGIGHITFFGAGELSLLANFIFFQIQEKHAVFGLYSFQFLINFLNV